MLLKEKFGTKFVVTCELGGTDGTDVDRSLEDAKQLDRADALNIIDCAMANLRINTFALAHMIQGRLGITCVPHLTRRDRSILGLQSDLIGAHALGVRHVLATTGDPPDHGPYKDSKGVFNITTSELIKMIDNLNKGKDYNGDNIKGNTEFAVSATATPASKNMDKQFELVKKKVDAGAAFLQTQPVYDADQAKTFIDRMKPLKIPILIGVMPLKSVKMAKYMNEKVPGIEVPDHVLEKFEKYGLGVPVANEFIDEIYDIADGIHVLAMGNVKNMNGILDHLETRN